jgi:hypothetical protein
LLADIERGKKNACLLLQESDKPINGKPGVTDDGTECAPVEFFMVGDHYLCKGILPTENHVSRFLTLHEEASPFQGSSTFPP